MNIKRSYSIIYNDHSSEQEHKENFSPKGKGS